jgi:hypothetical protein
MLVQLDEEKGKRPPRGAQLAATDSSAWETEEPLRDLKWRVVHEKTRE